jgi:hypothetical protein
MPETKARWYHELSLVLAKRSVYCVWFKDGHFLIGEAWMDQIMYKELCYGV